jgi:hypothetical protein
VYAIADIFALVTSVSLRPNSRTNLLISHSTGAVKKYASNNNTGEFKVLTFAGALNLAGLD